MEIIESSAASCNNSTIGVGVGVEVEPRNDHQTTKESGSVDLTGEEKCNNKSQHRNDLGKHPVASGIGHSEHHDIPIAPLMNIENQQLHQHQQEGTNINVPPSLILLQSQSQCSTNSSSTGQIRSEAEVEANSISNSNNASIYTTPTLLPSFSPYSAACGPVVPSTDYTYNPAYTQYGGAYGSYSYGTSSGLINSSYYYECGQNQAGLNQDLRSPLAATRANSLASAASPTGSACTKSETSDLFLV